MTRLLLLSANLLAFALIAFGSYAPLPPHPVVAGDALYLPYAPTGNSYGPPPAKPQYLGNTNNYGSSHSSSYSPAPVYGPNYAAPQPYSSIPPQNSYQANSMYQRPSPAYGIVGPSYGPMPSYGHSYARKPVRKQSYEVAEVILRGYSANLNENNNKAVIKLYQDRNLGLNVNMRLCNLTANTYYSFYVHQFGELNNGCESTGPQYTTRPITTHPLTGLQTHPTGFLGFIKTNNESQIFQTNTKEIYLEDIIGRSVVIHELAVNASALPTPLNESVINNLSLFLNPGPNSFIVGRRLACGIIGRANPITFNRPIDANCEVVLPSANQQNIVNLSSVFGNQVTGLGAMQLRNVNQFSSTNPNLINQPKTFAKPSY